MVKGSIYSPIRADNYCKVIKVLVVPSLKHSLILGSDVLKEFCLTLGFQKNNWSVFSGLINSVNVVCGICGISQLNGAQLREGREGKASF